MAMGQDLRSMARGSCELLTMISLELDVCWNLEVRYVLSRDIRRSLKIDGELNHVKYMQAKWKGQ